MIAKTTINIHRHPAKKKKWKMGKNQFEKTEHFIKMHSALKWIDGNDDEKCISLITQLLMTLTPCLHSLHHWPNHKSFKWIYIYVLQQSSKLNGTQHTHDSAKVIARNSVLWHRTHTQRKYRKRWQRENKHGKKRMHDTLNGMSILTFDAHKFIVKSTHTHTHAQLFHCSKAISMHSDNWQFSAANRIWRSNQRYFFSLSLIVYIYLHSMTK